MWLRMFRESLAFAFGSVIVNKLRTFLSLFGITIGIVSIISVFTVFDWMESNVGYDDSKYYNLTSGFIRKLGIFGDEAGYRNSQEVLDDEEGICGELAFLYVTMARSVGLESNVAQVDIDKFSDKVNHACAVVKADGKRIFVDPAYDTFDIHHKKIEILSDKDVIERYKRWRYK